jgi:NADH dehydrogenase
VERVERIRVNQFSQVKVMMIFCCSIASMETEELQGHPMMAQPALQQGKLLGKNIVN